MTVLTTALASVLVFLLALIGTPAFLPRVAVSTGLLTFFSGLTLLYFSQGQSTDYAALTSFALSSMAGILFDARDVAQFFPWQDVSMLFFICPGIALLAAVLTWRRVSRTCGIPRAHARSWLFGCSALFALLLLIIEG
jgi:hypothetical protein